MSKFIYFEQFRKYGEEKAAAEKENSAKLIRNIAVAFVFVVWLLIYLFLFSSKGIYLNDNFYKKSPTIKNISYNAVKSRAIPQNILMTKHIGTAYTFVIDGQSVDFTLSSLENGEATAVVEGYAGDEFMGISLTDLAKIALQKDETIRGRLPSFLCVLALVILALLAKLNAAKLYGIKNKTKVPGEKYFLYFDIILCGISVLGILYLTLTL
ncbi:MAG: hypothetical protein RR253_03255 [Oscillospiraceae bacterium]